MKNSPVKEILTLYFFIQRLCVLSRILGIFHVGFKNSSSGEAHRFDVLVMENLFHGHTNLSYIYDLKGSLRKRLAHETHKPVAVTPHDVPSSDSSKDANLINNDGSTNDASGMESRANADNNSPNCPTNHVPVLLDQNLLNASVDNPLYLRVHSKVGI